MSTTLIVVIVAIALVSVFVSIYNKLVAYVEAVRNNEKQIDIQLDRRYKVFESLVATVSKYMNYEQTTLKDVVGLRAQAESAKAAGNSQGRIDAENKISGILGGINAVFEQYPDLKANQNALQLQEEIVSTENKLAYAKQAYNDSIEKYNAYKKSFFQAMVANVSPAKLNIDFTYWQLTSDQVKQQENYTVKF